MNEYLNIVVELPIRVNLIHQCEFIDETNQLLTAGADGAFLIDILVKYKYDPRQAILLDPKGHSINVSYCMPQCNKSGKAYKIE